jgi:hypothetical protein
MALENIHTTNQRTAQDFRRDRTEAENKISAILQELEEKYPGYKIESIKSWTQTLTGCNYLKVFASIEIQILNV